MHSRSGDVCFAPMTNLIFVLLWVCVLLRTEVTIAQPDSLDDIYTTRAVVTGTDERNRPLGFKLCFEDVLVKVSGDASILSDHRFEILAASAGQYVICALFVVNGSSLKSVTIALGRNAERHLPALRAYRDRRRRR
jgi:hypothetical protein